MYSAFGKYEINILFLPLNLRWDRLLKYIERSRKRSAIPCSQRHGCWCPGDARIWWISGHSILLVLPLQFSFINRITTSWRMNMISALKIIKKCMYFMPSSRFHQLLMPRCIAEYCYVQVLRFYPGVVIFITGKSFIKRRSSQNILYLSLKRALSVFVSE